VVENPVIGRVGFPTGHETQRPMEGVGILKTSKTLGGAQEKLKNKF